MNKLPSGGAYSCFRKKQRFSRNTIYFTQIAKANLASEQK